MNCFKSFMRFGVVPTQKLSTKAVLFGRSVFLVSALALNLCGCVYLVVGSVGALGGYAISSDTVLGTVEYDFDDVWLSAETVINIMGRLTKENQDAGRLEALINNARVTIGVVQFTPKLVKVSVKARKSFFPNISTAQEVYVKIISNLGR